MSSLDRVRAVVAKTFDVEISAIDAQTCAANMKAWDSLAHLMIITAVERDFGVKLPRLESYTVKNVGELAALVERTTAARKS